jgi:phosphatidylglycerophosphate synthase
MSEAKAHAAGPWARARADLARMGKPREVEEWLDLHVIRPTGFVFVQLLRGTSVTPNMVSVSSLVAGVAIGASYLAFYGRPLGAWLGLLFMVIHSGLDAADGQLARATGRTSPHGRVVDGLCDSLAFAAIYACLVLAHALAGGPLPGLVLALAILAGLSHSTHCALTELQRMLFLTYCFGTHDTVSEQPEALRRRLGALKRERAPWPSRLLARLLLNYSVQQRSLLRSSDALERLWARATAERPGVREAFAGLYRTAMERPLRTWAWLGPNSHKVALVASGFLAAAPAGSPLALPAGVGMLVYLAYDLVVLNVVMAVLVARQRRIDRRLAATLEQLRLSAAPAREG